MRGWFNLKKAPLPNGSGAVWRRYQLGIYARYTRESSGWQSHLSNSKARILSFVSRYKPRSITILGSGWLLDVPIDELSKHCDRIILIDCFHPRQAQATARRFNNVELLHCDVTGGLERIKPNKKDWESYTARVGKLELPELPLTEAAVSLNLMSQLALPIQERYAAKIPFEAYRAAAASLEASHLALLNRFPHWLLITDTEERHSQLSNGATLPSIQTIVAPLPPLQHTQNWEWEFDTKGFYQSGHRVTLQVESGENTAEQMHSETLQ